MKKVCLFICLLMLTGIAPAQDESAWLLYLKGLKQEDQNNLDKAIEYYQTAGQKTEEGSELMAKILWRLGNCYEKKEEIENAQAEYQKLLDFENPFKKEAQRKVKWRGIDFYVNKFRAFKGEWKLNPDPDTLKEQKDNLLSSIDQLYQTYRVEIVPGLLNYISDTDKDISEVSTNAVKKYLNENTISSIINHLLDEDERVCRGAEFILEYIFTIYSDVKDIQRNIKIMREQIEVAELFKMDVPAGAETIGIDFIEKVREGAGKIKAKLNELEATKASIQGNIPDELAIDEIISAFEEVLKKEGVSEKTICSVLNAIAKMGTEAQKLEDAVMKFLKDENPSIRTCAISALGGTKSAKAIDELMRICRYQCEQDPSPDRDKANISVVRQKAVEALAEIGAVRAVPAIIDALNDNFQNVRISAGNAINKFSNLELKFNPSDEKEYNTQIDIVKEWWQKTGGMDYVLEKFERFCKRWPILPPILYFYPEFHKLAVKYNKYPEKASERLLKLNEIFASAREEFLEEFVKSDGYLLDKFIENLVVHIKFSIEREIPYGKEDKTYKFTASKDKKYGIFVKYMVANAIAKLAEQRPEEVWEKLRSVTDQDIGIAISVALCPGLQTDEAIDYIKDRIARSNDKEVVQACAFVLAQLNSVDTLDALLDGLINIKNEFAQACILATIYKMDIDDVTARKSVCERIAKEYIKKNAFSEESGIKKESVFGKWISTLIFAKLQYWSEKTMESLLNMRIHGSKTVANSAGKAISKIAEKHLQKILKYLQDRLKDERKKVEDEKGDYKKRMSIMLAYGDTGYKGAVDLLIKTLTKFDKNVKKPKEIDPQVRSACIESLYKLKPKSRVVVEALLRTAQNDPSFLVSSRAIDFLIKIGKDIGRELKIDKMMTRTQKINACWEWFEENRDRFEE